MEDLQKFYGLLEDLGARMGGPRHLSTCHGRMEWPSRGVYFFLEDGEKRLDSGAGPRVVRVGTHALAARSRTTLWNRLSQHRGVQGGLGGNHRGSIFRLLVGAALIEAEPRHACKSWGVGSTADGETRERERDHERRVSAVVGNMGVLWIGIEDDPGPGSFRGFVERNAIALLSNYGKAPLDPPSNGWLGRRCPRAKIRSSGLWNSNHVDEPYDPGLLGELARLVHGADRGRENA